MILPRWAMTWGCLVMLGCAAMPLFPNTAVYVGAGHTLATYEADAVRCRAFALDHLGTENIRQEIRQAAIKGLIATLVGAGIGAALGAGTGGLFITLAAAGGGAGAGMLGLGHGREISTLLQARYDVAYGVCMDYAGHRVKDGVP